MIDEKDLIKLLKDKKKNESRFSKKIVISIIILAIAFVIAILFVFLKTGSEPTVLVGSFMAFISVELWSLAKIKRSGTEEEENE